MDGDLHSSNFTTYRSKKGWGSQQERLSSSLEQKSLLCVWWPLYGISRCQTQLLRLSSIQVLKVGCVILEKDCWYCHFSIFTVILHNIGIPDLWSRLHTQRLQEHDRHLSAGIALCGCVQATLFVAHLQSHDCVPTASGPWGDIHWFSKSNIASLMTHPNFALSIDFILQH